MSSMDYVYGFTGRLVIDIALFKRELLTQKKSFTIILGISIVLFLTVILLHFTESDQGSFCGALFNPLLSLDLLAPFAACCLEWLFQ